jgi:hypothetical protein
MTKYFGILVLLAFFSCNDQNSSFDIGGKYIDLRTTLRYIDTMTVNSFSVRLDSVHTSGLSAGSIMAGMYHDPKIGDIQSTSYFRMGLPGSRIVFRGAVYDSICLILVDNNYSIGDTMVPMTLQVHRLSQHTVLKTREDGYLYNTSSFAYDPELFGSATFIPRPNRNDTLSIKLDDSFGNELFNLLKTRDDKILNLDNFFTYFPGLALTFDETDNAILGYSNSGDLPTMRLYYHYFDFSILHKYFDFSINSAPSLQFNQIEIKNPVEEWPVKQTEKLSSRLTHNMSYLQGGTGIVTRFEIPYLKNLRELYSNTQVLRAELILEPAKDSYKTLKLPTKTSLYGSDHLNRFSSPLQVPITGGIQIGTLVIDDIFQEETSYSFDVTDFINTRLTAQSDEIPALLLQITPEDMYKTTDRLVLGSQLNSTNKVKLKIYYMNYE